MSQVPSTARRTPWTDPQPGDSCCWPKLESCRVVRRVLYRGHGELRPHEDRRDGDWVDGVVYVRLVSPLDTRERSCSGSSWADWCRNARRNGGCYADASGWRWEAT